MHKPHITSNYRKESARCVGEGGTGGIYIARNITTGERVILKEIKLNSIDEGLSISGLRESCILSACRHENIIRIIETYYWRKNITLVLELCEKDIGAVLNDGYTIPKEFRKSIFFMALRGLQYLHSKWILHRDIKLSNILITADGTIKLADFGLSRYYKCNGFDTGNVGTQTYRAPELILKGQQSTPASDVWSMGICFCEIIFGCDGSSHTFYDIVSYEISKMTREPGPNNCRHRKIINTKDFKAEIPKSHGDVSDTTMMTTLKEALGYPSPEERHGLSHGDIYHVIFPEERNGTEDGTVSNNRSQPLRDVLYKYGGSEEEIDLILCMLNWSPYVRYTSDQCLNHRMFANMLSNSKHEYANKLDSQINHSVSTIIKHKLSEFPRNNQLTMRLNQPHKQITIPRLNAHSLIQDRVMDFDTQVQLHNIDGQRELSYSFLLGTSMFGENSNTPHCPQHDSDKYENNAFSRHPLPPEHSDESSGTNLFKRSHTPSCREQDQEDPVLLTMVNSLSNGRSEDQLENIHRNSPFGCLSKSNQQNVSQPTTANVDDSWDDAH